MIRKDQLPRIWDDDWKCADVPALLTVTGASTPLVECHDDNRSLLLLDSQDKGYAIQDEVPSRRVVLEAGASISLYRLQWHTGSERHLYDLEVEMHEGAELKICTITLGGGHVRNNIVVRMKGEHCRLEANGLYLMDREEQCDNYIFVEHACPNCTSHELYKGIIDDSARARFNGHVLVQDGAVKTEALMTNRNILLTDKAHVDTRPFLEIYNDDVKCSHGSTIGQLDEQAKFYLMTRGISEKTAVTMLSYAFCDEVIRSISIDTLRDTVGDMVKKRLHGELSSSCADCAIACAHPCNGHDAHFDIDASKL